MMRLTSASWGIAFLTIAAVTLWASLGMAQTEWEKYPGNPVLDLGPSGAWDDDDAFNPSVLFDGTEYKMWYTGDEGGHNLRIGFASSPDGVVWTKSSANPVLDWGTGGTWDDDVDNPSVIFDGIQYKMWYFEDDGPTYRTFGYATSPDGIIWTKYHGNPVLERGPSGSWDDSDVHDPSVLFDGFEYKMWYTGSDGSHRRIGYATSQDGIVWIKYAGNPVLDLGSSGSWDDSLILGPSVLFNGDQYELWYEGDDGSNRRIGYATSPDGIIWTKYHGNPVLGLGPSGTWDDTRGSGPSVLFDGDQYQLWYGGFDGSNRRIGYAVSLPECWDVDGDGSWDESCGGFDCDDSDPDIHMDAVEVCDDAIDNDCDDLIDDLDPDCFPEFILDVDASFTGGKLYLDYTLGTERQSTWINYAILGYPGTLEFIHLWTIQVPELVPPVEIPLSFWFPSVGYVGIYSAIYAGGLPEISLLEWVDTGK